MLMMSMPFSGHEKIRFLSMCAEPFGVDLGKRYRGTQNPEPSIVV